MLLSTDNNNIMSVTVNYAKLTTATSERALSEFFSDELTRTISKVTLYGFTPAIGVIGVIGNIFSMMILKRHGLHKCSNILLISLAFMDMSFLISYNSIPYIIYFLHGDGRFLYSRTVSQILYVLYFFYIVPDYTFCFGALCIPMLITIERLVAVYMPLKFGQIITPARTWTAVISIGLFWILTMTYTCLWYKFEYVFDEVLNRSVGIISKSDLYYRQYYAIPIFTEVLFSIKVPPLITVIGCVAIIIKVRISSHKRKKMTSSSKQSSTSRTTKTLLCVSFAYVFTCTVMAIPNYLPAELSTYKLTTDKPTNGGIIVYQLVSLLTMLNSAWNFLLYIVMNKNFRDTFKELLPCRNCSDNTKS